MYKLERISVKDFKEYLHNAGVPSWEFNQLDHCLDNLYLDAQLAANRLILDQANAEIARLEDKLAHLCEHCDTPLLTEVERARIKDLEAINQSHKELNGRLRAELNCNLGRLDIAEACIKTLRANQLTAEEADFLVSKINWCVGCIDNIKRPSCVDTCVPGLVAKLKAQVGEE